MRGIRTEIDIAAPISKVWNTLTDFENWKEWNPISQASGIASLGSKLNVTMGGCEGKNGHSYMPMITQLEEPKLFRWRATMMAGLLFTNDKVFELEEIGSGTRLVHREELSGILVPLFWSKLNQGVPSMLQSMNDALKTKAEKSSDS